MWRRHYISTCSQIPSGSLFYSTRKTLFNLYNVNDFSVLFFETQNDVRRSSDGLRAAKRSGSRHGHQDGGICHVNLQYWSVPSPNDEGRSLNTPIVAVAAGALLPHLARRDKRLLAHEGDEDQDAELSRLRTTVLQWRADAARKGQPLKLPLMPFFLRNIWTGAMLLFSLITFSTFFITKVWQVCRSTSRSGMPLSYRCTGRHCGQPGWNLLGGSLLGAICYHNGGMIAVYCLL